MLTDLASDWHRMALLIRLTLASKEIYLEHLCLLWVEALSKLWQYENFFFQMLPFCLPNHERTIHIVNSEMFIVAHYTSYSELLFSDSVE